MSIQVGDYVIWNSPRILSEEDMKLAGQSFRVLEVTLNYVELYIGPEYCYLRVMPNEVQPLETNCDCGAKKLGYKAKAPGHARWCKVA